MKKNKIILDTSIIIALSEQQAKEFFHDYTIFITPTNLFELFTHSQAKKIKTPEDFIKSKLQLYKSLNAEFLPDRDTLIKKELYTSSNDANKILFSKLMDEILNGNINVSSSIFKTICIKDPIKIAQDFANDIEKAKQSLRKYCTDPMYEKEHIDFFGKPYLDYNQERLQVFDKLNDCTSLFINNLTSNLSQIPTITKKDIEKFSQLTFIQNLYYSFKQLERRIIKSDRKAEKSDYFDFEFLIYICSPSIDIDVFITKNKRDFQELLPQKPQLQQKIRILTDL